MALITVAIGDSVTVLVGGLLRDTFDAVTVASSAKSRLFWVGSKGIVAAETKWLHLFAINVTSAPHRQAIRCPGNTVLCIPLVHGSYPAVMNDCAFSRENACW